MLQEQIDSELLEEQRGSLSARTTTCRAARDYFNELR
jgi:hypothetical protein